MKLRGAFLFAPKIDTKLDNCHMLIESSSSQLVLIDIQAKLLPAMFEGADVLANALRLAQAARLMRVPITVT